MSGDRTDELRQRAERVAQEHLRHAGVDLEAPDPRAVWRAFKAFAAAAIVEPRTITIGYEAYNAADRDRVLWLSFMRSVETDSGVGWHVGYCLSCSVPTPLVGVQDANWWWVERLTLDAWFVEVEGNAVAQQCFALDGWKWEGFSD